jgi:hypothetical protein
LTQVLDHHGDVVEPLLHRLHLLPQRVDLGLAEPPAAVAGGQDQAERDGQRGEHR